MTSSTGAAAYRPAWDGQGTHVRFFLWIQLVVGRSGDARSGPWLRTRAERSTTMLLKSLSFEDKRTGWKLEDLRLDRFNLLVGASGVGKTRILRALRVVHRIGQGGLVGNLEHAFRCDVRFEHEGLGYGWQLDSAVNEL